MKGHALCIVLVFTFVLPASGQKKNGPAVDGIFAGKIGVSDKAGDNYTIEELRKSDWTILVADPNYTVTEFKMSLVFKAGTPSHAYFHGYASYEIKGNSIPENYRDKILNQTKEVYLEYIQAVNERRVYITVKPIAIRIHS